MVMSGLVYSGVTRSGVVETNEEFYCILQPVFEAALSSAFRTGSFIRLFKMKA